MSGATVNVAILAAFAAVVMLLAVLEIVGELQAKDTSSRPFDDNPHADPLAVADEENVVQGQAIHVQPGTGRQFRLRTIFETSILRIPWRVVGGLPSRHLASAAASLPQGKTAMTRSGPTADGCPKLPKQLW